MSAVAKTNDLEKTAQGETLGKVSCTKTLTAFHLALQWATVTMDTSQIPFLIVLFPRTAQSDIRVC